ncbi:extracellular fatty acid-binding protein [Balearica regulorum gibbericeps]|uniref:extracellular fatty acid-binding protein n=1 Tax=Balearica regulorum gibbericeps TaxID=100784 RepID=UPI000532678E|nr:PREDICTED: extracellular fatty acid-binding protein-like [Balearica regulorum gibbericeps]
MTPVVLSLGLALLCLLRVEAEDLGAAGLDKSKIAGKWHIIALASNSESYLRKKDQLKMAMATIAVLGEGDLKVSFAILTPEGCKKLESIYKPSGVPGEYYSSDRGNKTAQVVDTDGRTYAVIFASRVKDGKTFHMLKLYSRTREASPKITALFKKLAREKSFTDEMIKMLPSQEECSLDEA